MKNKKIFIYIAFALILLFGTVGITYAWFSTNVIGNESAKSTVIKSGNLKASFNDSDTISGVVSPGWTSGDNTFTINNVGDNEITYSIIWENVNNEFINKNDLTYNITSTNPTINLTNIIFPSTGTNLNINGLTNIVLQKNQTHTYTLNVKYALTSENQSSDMGKSFSAKLKAISTKQIYK